MHSLLFKVSHHALDNANDFSDGTAYQQTSLITPLSPLCLEDKSAEGMLDALRQVKVSLRDLPETANLTDEWPRLVESLGLAEKACGGFLGQRADDDDSDVCTDVCYDVDMLGIGMSHLGCRWGNISTLSRDPKLFLLDFEPSTNSSQTGLGLHAWFVHDSKRTPFRFIPQLLIAKVHFGSFVCDLVLFGNEKTADVSGFRSAATGILSSAMENAAANVCLRMRSSLNHLATSLRNPTSASSTFTISDTEASALILNTLQKSFPSDHHILLVDFGCKCRSCTSAFESSCSTRRSHCERAWSTRSMSPLPEEWDWEHGFRDILASNLNMDAVQQNTTFMIADLGVEFSSLGRFMHWTPGACKLFQSAFGGKGSLYFALGVRQLASYTTRATEFERFFLTF